MATRTKRCMRCGEEKAVGRFGLRKDRPDGRQSYCLECARAYWAGRRERRAAAAGRGPVDPFACDPFEGTDDADALFAPFSGRNAGRLRGTSRPGVW